MNSYSENLEVRFRRVRRGLPWVGYEKYAEMRSAARELGKDQAENVLKEIRESQAKQKEERLARKAARAELRKSGYTGVIK